MESGAGDWTHGGAQDEWERGDPDWGDPYSGGNCWGTDLAPWPWDEYEDGSDEWLMSGEIDLTPAASSTLYFQTKYRTENGNDFCYVDIEFL